MPTKELTKINYNGEEYLLVDSTADEKFSPTGHVHGYITSAGAVTTTITASTVDKLILSDASDQNKIVAAEMSAATSTLLNSLGEGTSPAQMGDYIIAQYAGGGTTTKTYHRRKLSNLLTATNITTGLGNTPVARATSDANGNNIIDTYATLEDLRAMGSAVDAMRFKGTIGTSGTTTVLPATHKVGDTYRVITASNWIGEQTEVGDLIICITDGTSNNTAHWIAVQGNLDGTVIGPASATDNHVAVFSGATGKLIKDSGFTIAKSVPSDAKFTDTTYSLTSTGSGNAVTGVSLSGTQFTVTKGNVAASSHSHGNILNDGTMTATVGIANGDRLVLVDADGNKITGSGLTFGASTATSSVLSQAGTWVAMYTHPTSDGNKHVPATGTSNGGKFLQAGSTAGTFNWVALTHTVSGTPSASRTITSFTQSNGAITVSFSDIAINASQVSGLPTSLPPTSHTHGNITNDGKIGTTSVADYVVVTTTNGALTTISLTTSDPAASGTATKFISGISQSSNGKISATKASLPSASTSTAGIIKIGTTANDAAAGNHNHDTVYVKKAGDAMTGRLIMNNGVPVNQILTGSGTAATTSGSNYYPAKWTFNTGITVTDGDIYTIKIPVAGHDYGVFMTVDGTNYYPVVVNGTARVTTHYPVNNYIQVVFEASGSAASVFPVAGGTSRVNPSGGVFRVINYYDSGNSGIYQNYNAKAFKVGSTAITQYDLVAEDAGGLLVPAHKVAHRVGSPIYITDTAYAANATGSWKGLYDRHYNCPLRNSGTTLSTTNYNPVFLKGTIANGMFTPDTTTPYIFTKAGCNVSGAYYMYVGDATTNSSYIAFNNIHPYYYYDGTNLVSYTERAGVTDWSNITNKPSSFTPASHNHDSTYLKLSGGTLTGALTLNANPTANMHAATKQYVDNSFAANDAMIFKGTLGTGGTITSLPATHNAGWTYRVITAGTYAGKVCEVGDLMICVTDSTSANDAHWTVAQTNIDGAVTGPASATDAHVAVFSGTTGKLIKDSGFTIAKSVPSDAKFTDTTYSAEKGISLTSGKFGHSNTAITAQTTQAVYPIKIDAYGHITGYGSAQTILTIGTGASNAAAGNHTHTTSITSGGTSQINLSANTAYTLTAGGTTVVFKTPADGNTDTKVNVVARGTSKSYLLADTTSPTGTAAAHTAVAETGIYMTTTAGELNATQFKVNEAVTLQYNSTTKSLDFIFA